MRLLSALLLLVILFYACTIGGRKVSGSGNVISQERGVADFKEVTVDGSLNAILAQGSSYSVRVEADDNFQEYIETKAKGDRLVISTRNGFDLNSRRDIIVYITAPQFTAAEVNGSGNIKSVTKLSGNETLRLSVEGSGNIDLDIDAPEVKAEVGGSGNITVKGTTKTFTAGVGGSGNIYGFNLLSEDADVDLAGSGNAEVYASKQLKVDVAGSGSVDYKGSPAVKSNIAGSGSVNKKS